MERPLIDPHVGVVLKHGGEDEGLEEGDDDLALAVEELDALLLAGGLDDVLSLRVLDGLDAELVELVEHVAGVRHDVLLVAEDQSLPQEFHYAAHYVLREVLKHQLQVVPEEHLQHCKAPPQNLGVLLKFFKVLAANRTEISHCQLQEHVVSIVGADCKVDEVSIHEVRQVPAVHV